MSHVTPNKADPSTLKGKKLIDDSRSRYYSRNSIKFSAYDLHVTGITGAKPAVAYYSEIAARVSSPYLIGLEIECENASSLNAIGNALNTYIPHGHYVCRDGSLQNSGIEIVTAPRSPNELTQNYHRYYGLLNALREAGCTAHDNARCGLHVHISRPALPNDTWVKLAKFVSRNSVVFKKLSRRIGSSKAAGNSDFYFCNFAVNSGSRYSAVNLTCSGTVEFRFFRGTLKPATFFASLEIIRSLVEFFRVPAKSYGLKQYLKFVRSGQFKYAASYIQDQCPDIITENKRYTEAEREQRRLARKEKQRQRILQIQRELDQLISFANSRICTPYNGTTGIIDRSKDTIVVKVKPVPVIISSDFRRELTAYAKNELRTVRLAYYPETVTPTEEQNLHVFISRTRGWGTDRRNVRVRTSPVSCY